MTTRACIALEATSPGFQQCITCARFAEWMSGRDLAAKPLDPPIEASDGRAVICFSHVPPLRAMEVAA